MYPEGTVFLWTMMGYVPVPRAEALRRFDASAIDAWECHAGYPQEPFPALPPITTYIRDTLPRTRAKGTLHTWRWP